MRYCRWKRELVSDVLRMIVGEMILIPRSYGISYVSSVKTFVLFVFLDPRPSALILGPRLSTSLPLALISLAVSPQNIRRLNTILLFNFEVVITLKF